MARRMAVSAETSATTNKTSARSTRRKNDFMNRDYSLATHRRMTAFGSDSDKQRSALNSSDPAFGTRLARAMSFCAAQNLYWFEYIWRRRTSLQPTPTKLIFLPRCGVTGDTGPFDLCRNALSAACWAGTTA